MNLPLVALKAFPFWNKRTVTEQDLQNYCKRNGIHIAEGKIDVPGLYVINEGVPFIVIDPDLKGFMRAWVLLHELAHHLLHAPSMQLFDKRFETKADREANFIAAVALLPCAVLETKNFADLLEEGYPAELLWLRKEIYEQFRI